jgi:hypothetical protein
MPLLQPFRSKKLPFRLASLLPEKHYARKNLGYLLSKESPLIIETDDDNMPQEEFWRSRHQHMEARRIAGGGWVNAYRFFFRRYHLAPRIPVGNDPSPTSHGQRPGFPCQCSIQQGLCDGDPDTDAIFRLTKKPPMRFHRNGQFAMGKNSWCPFNSQNTTWFKDAFFLLYLPSTCSSE